MKKLYYLPTAILFCLLTFFLNYANVNAQNYQWAKAMGGTGQDYGQSLAVDSAGNVYTTGFFQNTADFDPGVELFNLTSAGNEDIFVSKSDASGNFVWAKQIGGPGSDNPPSIAVDNLGNIFITGYFSSTVDFDPESGTFNLSSFGGDDIFVCKLNSNGNFIWAKSIGATSGDHSQSIVVDSNGNILITGDFQGTVDFDPGPGAFNLTSAGTDIFVCKLDFLGDFVWAKRMGNAANCNGNSIAVDNIGNVYTTGFFQGTVDFDPGLGTFDLSATVQDVFVNKLDASGNFLWAAGLGGSQSCTGYSIAIDGFGNVFTTGSLQGVADFDPGAGTFNLTSGGSQDIFVSKLNSSGDFLWARQIGKANSEYGKSISVDADGNIYTTGFFSDTVDFDPGSGVYNISSLSVGYDDIFVSKIDSTGSFIWAKSIGGTGYDFGHSIGIDVIGNFYITGIFENTTDFDSGTGVDNLTSVGLKDIFLAKFDNCGLLDSDSDSIFNDCDPDDDNDGIADGIDGSIDTDADGVINSLDTDSDNDGISDATEGASDYDGDSLGNFIDTDSDQDGTNDSTDTDAGITVTSSDMPFIGLVVKTANDTTPSSVSSGSAGIYQVWDFTTFQQEDSVRINFTDPNTLAGSSEFPGSNLGAFFPYDTMSQFFNSASSGFELKGLYGNFGYGLMPVKYIPNFVWLSLPANYQNTNGGNYDFIFQVYYGQFGVDSIRSNYHKNYNSSIDGWGKISTPAYSNLNCLRQKTIVISNDTTYLLQTGSWNFNSTNIDTSITYRWWSDSLNLFVAEVETDLSGTTKNASYQKAALPCNLTVSISSMDATCNASCNGNAISTVSGNTGPVNYLWSNASSATSVSNLCAGIYYLTVTDDACSVVDSFTINEPDILIPNAPDGNVSCFGSCDGTTTASPTGGTSPYSYSWSNGQSGITVTNLCPSTNHYLTVTDINNCEAILGFTVFEPQQLSVNVSPSLVCQGQCNGIASAAGIGGVSPYSYMWNDIFIQTTQTATGLCSGSYNVTVTDGNGCTASQNITINEFPSLSVSVNQTNINCYGQCDGTATPVVSGGAAPYIFNWSNGTITADSMPAINNLCSGLFDVSVTDSNNCSANSPQFSIGDAYPLNVFVSISDANCNGCQNGSAQIDSVTGGTPPYSFNWSNGQTGNGISGIGSGNYNVIITDSNGCTLTYNFNINQPMQANINFINDTNYVCAPFIVNFSNQSNGNFDFYWNVRGNYLDTTINADSISYLFESGGYYEVELCAFDSIGNNVGCAIKNINILGFSLQMSADSACPGNTLGFQVYENFNGGGNGESSYTWDFGDGSPAAIGGDKNLHSYDSEGAYTVSVIGNHPQCGPDTVSKTIIISNNVIPTVYYFTEPETSCPNDMISFMPYNASGIYSWNFGDGSPVVSNQLFETEHSFTDTGFYIVTVSVANSCGNSDSYSDTVFIKNNIGFSQNQNFNYFITPNPVCPGDQVKFQYEYPNNFSSYTWNFGDGSSDSNNLKALHSYSTAGTYFSSITVVNGCGYDTTLFDTISVQNNVPVNPGDYQFLPIPLSICPGDSVLFLADDGAQQYMWHFGDGDSAVPYGIGSGDMTAYNHAFSDTGSYYASLTITNSCGNSLTDTFPLPVVVSTNVVPSINPMMGQAFGTLGSGLNETQPVCVPDSFIALTGGSLFHWDFGDGTPVVTSPNIIVVHTYIYSGTYTVSLIAENSCGNSDTFSVILNVGGVCPSPSVTISSGNPTCSNGNNGYALAQASGGNAPYSYQWSNGKTTALNGNLLAGSYSVTVTDANGQTAIAGVTLTAPAPITLTMSANPAGCSSANGLASVTASGGQTPYTYLWSNGQTSNIASNLAAGQYSVTVTAANGCKVSGTTTVNSSTGFSATFTGTNVNCNGAGNGSAAINATGGITPYTYLWSNGQSTASLSGLSAGTYNATVTDGNGCGITGTVQISQPSVLAVNLNGSNVSSCGGNNGSVNLTAFGGVSPYTYLWSNNATSEDISNLTAGIYSVTVTDANGCTKNKNVVIVAPSTATLSITKTNASCNGACNGTALVSVSGGTSPYNYYWSNGSVNSTATGLCAGTFNVTVIDSTGCANTGSVIITQPPALIINATAFSANCGQPTGSAIANCNGGTSPYTYQWTSGDTSYTADSLTAGLYLVTGTDANGCKVFVSVQVSDIGSPNVSLVSFSKVSCYGENDGAINIAVTGTSTPFTYEWSNGASSQDISNLVAGPYEVTVTNSNGCVAVESMNIPQPDELSVSVSLNNATCGNPDGDASVTVAGGTTPYSYNWENGQITSTATGLQWGVYDITVTDSNNCTIVSSAPVGEVGGPLVTLDSIVEASCAGTGSVFVSVADGVPPYTYDWDNGSVSEDLFSVLVGNYGLIVTDANGCMGALSAQIINTEVIPDPICLLTVDTITGTNKIVWQKTFGMGILAYKIYRESSVAGIYQLAGTVSYDSLSVFTDTAANPLIHSWRYKLAAVDSCGNESLLSGEHKTIHLTVNQGIANTVNLIWDHYQGFPYGTYFIWRFKPSTGWVLLDSLASTLTSWTDFNPPTPFGLRYFIEIKHPDGCSATKSAENHNSSRSNKTYPLAPPPANLSAAIGYSNENGTCNGTATITASGGVSPYTYLWNNGETTPTLDSLCTGVYTCTVTDVDGDTAMVSVNIQLVNVFALNDGKATMKIFPNPNDGQFILTLSGNYNQAKNIIVYNVLGDEIYRLPVFRNNENNQSGSGQVQISLNLSEQGSGIYYLQLVSDYGNSSPMKIVVN